MDFQMTDSDFDLEAGELSLDFANTLDWHASDQPQENLNSYEDLINWGRAAGILQEEQAKQLAQVAVAHPSQAGATLERARELREAIYRIFVNYIEAAGPSQNDLEILNSYLKRALPHLRLLSDSEGFSLGWEENEQDLEQVLWPVVWSAVELLTSERVDRVGQCADDRGCGYLFYDTSRNRSRRWCSMESCGNRAKAMRHYEQTQSARRGS